MSYPQPLTNATEPTIVVLCGSTEFIDPTT